MCRYILRCNFFKKLLWDCIWMIGNVISVNNILKICNSSYCSFNYLRLCVCLLVIDNCRTTVPKTTDRPEFKIKTKTNHFDRLPKTYRPYFKGTATEPTLFTNPSVFFIFPLYFFLIQFSSRPQMAHLLLH